VGPRAVLDTVVKRKIPSPRRESNPRTPIIQPVAQETNEEGQKSHKLHVGRATPLFASWDDKKHSVKI
jgi:hypothetical protein